MQNCIKNRPSVHQMSEVEIQAISLGEYVDSCISGECLLK